MNSFSEPVWMEDLWAKSAEKGEGNQPETLAKHTWLVLSRLADFIRLRPDLPQTIGVDRLWHILYWAAFLHDFGKATSGFQARLRGGERWPHRHEVFSLAFLDWIVGDLTLEEQAWIVAAIVSHHRDLSEILSCYPQPDDDDEEDQVANRMLELSEPTIRKLWRWLAECGAAWIQALGLTEMGVRPQSITDQEQAVAHVLNKGATRIYDWLRIYRRFVDRVNKSSERPLIIGTLALRGYLINSDHSASAHAGSLPQVRFERQQILTGAAIQADKLFNHQQQAAQTDGSALLIAPTGSGKTEAALLWASYQAEVTGNLPRLFYTLPYQASMNTMKLRLGDIFGANDVGLQHGRGLLALYRLLLERDYNTTKAAGMAKWSRNLAKLNYPPVRIFSPYQMLKGMYRLAGYEALLSDYHNAVFIFDEIHAYETKRLALILKTVEYLHKNFGARFLVMSATFPSLIKTELACVLGNPLEIRADQKLFDTFRRHRLVLLDGELLSEQGIQRVVADATAGKSVLVVCNLVDRAQTVYQELTMRLAEIGIQVELLHGRFNMRDRSAKESLIRDATGSKSKNRRPIVLVATQAVEVSLDIDLDTIYTDPAPLEALVQRFGRINRRGKQQTLAPVHVYRQPDDGQKIYDPVLVQGTLKILEREHERPIDESAIGDWLDEIYVGEVATRWQAEYSQTAKEFEEICLRPLRAFEKDPNLEDRFDEMFEGLEVLPECFYDEYKALREDDPIRANELLVPISLRRYHALANHGQIWPREKKWPYVVKAEYSPHEGLIFQDR